VDQRGRFPVFDRADLAARLDARRRIKIATLGVTGLTITALSAGVVPRMMAQLAASVIRDRIPYLLLLLALAGYWQAGQFFTGANLAVERRLERIDERMVAPVLDASCDPPPLSGC